MGEMKHFLHEHNLILNEAEGVVGKDEECKMCRQPINKLLDAFYTCNTSLLDGSPSSNCVGFFMHKTCFELPSTFTHPMYPQQPLSLFDDEYKKHEFYRCGTCTGSFQGCCYDPETNDFVVCLKCVTSELKSQEDRSLNHPCHNHPLTSVQSPAFFLCHACNTTATDLSYICTQCCFYVHKSCVDAPITYQSEFHNEHALILNYSIPEEYRTFLCYCGICERNISRISWVYYCANCRFFAHVKCASMSRNSEINDEADCGESNLMHFPAHDEASLHETMQQCIMKAANAHLHDTAIAEPSPSINHWAHKHQLALRNKNTQTLTLDLNRTLSETELLICDGCTNPISLVDMFYECNNSCNFFLHRSCAQFPKEIEHHLADKMRGVRVQKELGLFKCYGCGIPGNGIYMRSKTGSYFDIGCASLPRIIKHEAHRHPLNQLKCPNDFFCKACHTGIIAGREAFIYGCERCEFYIHIRCLLWPHLVKHRWDPHPLYLILSPKNVADHPHEYQCEFCSKQISTNTWFYHCNVCDLSFHNFCIDPYLRFSKIKFGATNFYSDSHPHSHGLTVVQNKKKRRCKICGEDAWRSRVLECSPCKYIAHLKCFSNVHQANII